MSLSQAFLDAVKSPSRSAAVLLTFEFGTGTYGFWTGNGSRFYNGLKYSAGGSIFDISDIVQEGDGSVSELTIGLSTHPGIGVEVLEDLYNEDWHLRPVTIQLAMLDPRTDQIVAIQNVFRGILDTAPFTESEGQAEIQARCLSKSIELSKGGNLYRNDATQDRYDPEDTSLETIGTLNGALKKELHWGQSQ